MITVDKSQTGSIYAGGMHEQSQVGNDNLVYTDGSKVFQLGDFTEYLVREDEHKGTQMSAKECMEFISKSKIELYEKIKNGETEEEYQIGAESYTIKEWDKIIEKVDKVLESIQKTNEFEKEKVLEKEKELENKKQKIPYGYLAKKGIITYNGVNFICDEESNSICLGDVSDDKNVLSIPLSEGGTLRVNRDNLDSLSKAIGMFSPEDVNRIIRAITQDMQCVKDKQQMKDEQQSIFID